MWYIFGIIFLIFLLLLCMKISVNIHGIYDKQRKFLVISIFIFFRAVKKTFTIYPPSKEATSQEIEEQNDVKESRGINHFIKNFHQLHTMGKKLLKRISIDSFCWQTSFGVGDAMETGIAAGGLWALKGGVIGFLGTYFALKKNVEINVEPVFQGKGMYTELKMTVSFRLLFISLSAIPIYFYWRKIRKDRSESSGVSL